LPSHYREALLLRDVQGLSYRKIAEQTGVAAMAILVARMLRRKTMPQPPDDLLLSFPTMSSALSSATTLAFEPDVRQRTEQARMSE